MLRKSTLWLGVLTLCMAVLTFYHLGSTAEPTTSWTATQPGQSDTVKFSLPVTISRMMIYDRPGTGLAEIEATSNGTTWNVVASIQQGIWTSNQWVQVNRTFSAREVRVVLRSGTVQLGQIGFFNNAGAKVHPMHTADNVLVDEPQTVPRAETVQNSSYFDEVYYPVDAYEYLHHMPITEAVHPPLAPEVMAVGILLFGNNPLAWRLFGAIAGILMVPLIYRIGRIAFKEGTTALLAAGAFIASGMSLVQSRVATLDVYAAVLALVFLYFIMMYIERGKRRDLYLAGVFLGLGVACKWNALFFFFGPLIWLCISVGRKRDWRWWLEAVGALGVVSAVVYALTYVPVFGWGSLSPDVFWQTQVRMLTFQLGERHYAWFAEPWWGMILDWKPYWLAYFQQGTHITTVSDVGNPLLWWGALLTVPWALWRSIRNREMMPFWLIVTYLLSILPWVFISRLTYSYYYFINVPLLVLITSYAVESLHVYVRTTYWTLTSCLFVVFLPIWMALPVSEQYLLKLEWLRGHWYF